MVRLDLRRQALGGGSFRCLFDATRVTPSEICGYAWGLPASPWCALARPDTPHVSTLEELPPEGPCRHRRCRRAWRQLHGPRRRLLSRTPAFPDAGAVALARRHRALQRCRWRIRPRGCAARAARQKAGAGRGAAPECERCELEFAVGLRARTHVREYSRIPLDLFRRG